MADVLYRTHALDSRRGVLDDLPSGIMATPEPDVATTDLRVRPDEAGHVLDATLPLSPNTWVGAGGRQIIWLGPDEWLVRDPAASPEGLETLLGRAVADAGGAAVDVSAQRTSLRLRGRHVRDLLATGCSLDLHPRSFRSGQCAQTTLGLAGVVLMALDDDGTDYRILVRPSFAGYLADWITDAASEFRDGSAP